MRIVVQDICLPLVDITQLSRGTNEGFPLSRLSNIVKHAFCALGFGARINIDSTLCSRIASDPLGTHFRARQRLPSGFQSLMHMRCTCFLLPTNLHAVINKHTIPR